MSSGRARKVGPRFVSFQFQGAVVIRNGTIKIVLALFCLTAVYVGLGKPRRQANRRRIVSNSTVEIVFAMKGNTPIVIRFCKSRLLREGPVVVFNSAGDVTFCFASIAAVVISDRKAR